MKKFVQELIEAGVDFSTKKALKRSLRLIGLKPENVDRLYVEFKNDHFREQFQKIEPRSKILFLPQCLRKLNCKATLSENGYKCTKCGNSMECKVYAIKTNAEKLGYMVFVCPGGSMVAKIITKYRPKAVMAVACIKELVMAAEELKIPGQGVELLKSGCVATDVDLERVLSLL